MQELTGSQDSSASQLLSHLEIHERGGRRAAFAGTVQRAFICQSRVLPEEQPTPQRRRVAAAPTCSRRRFVMLEDGDKAWFTVRALVCARRFCNLPARIVAIAVEAAKGVEAVAPGERPDNGNHKHQHQVATSAAATPPHSRPWLHQHMPAVGGRRSDDAYAAPRGSPPSTSAKDVCVWRRGRGRGRGGEGLKGRLTRIPRCSRSRRHSPRCRHSPRPHHTRTRPLRCHIRSSRCCGSRRRTWAHVSELGAARAVRPPEAVSVTPPDRLQGHTAGAGTRAGRAG